MTNVYDALPKVEIYKQNLDAFYRFMYDRHMVYVRRFQQRKPPPWTDNRILRDYKFTNVYRELDRGTIWYKDHIVPMAHSLKDIIWLTTAYRLVNNIQTFETCKIPLLKYWTRSRKIFRHTLKMMHRKNRVFTNAHLTLPTRNGRSKIDTYIHALDGLYKIIDGLTDRIALERRPEAVFFILHEIEGVGDFIAYEIWCDLVLTRHIQFTENDFVNAGPGCRVGLKCIFPTVTGEDEYIAKIKLLQREQGKHFSRLGLRFPYLYKSTPLTLRSIEHSLCEFSKYCKMLTGIGKQRMHFKPMTGEDPRGKQMIMRFPRLGVS